MVTQNLGDAVINQYEDNCVKMCLTDIWVTESQSDMETHQGKYCSSISLLFMRNKA